MKTLFLQHLLRFSILSLFVMVHYSLQDFSCKINKRAICNLISTIKFYQSSSGDLDEVPQNTSSESILLASVHF